MGPYCCFIDAVNNILVSWRLAGRPSPSQSQHTVRFEISARGLGWHATDTHESEKKRKSEIMNFNGNYGNHGNPLISVEMHKKSMEKLWKSIEINRNLEKSIDLVRVPQTSQGCSIRHLNSQNVHGIPTSSGSFTGKHLIIKVAGHGRCV